MQMRKCIFLDRDGTVNQEVGYLRRLSQIEILEGAAEGIRKWNENGFLVIIVSNQSGIARGYFSLETARQINAAIVQKLEHQGARIDDVYLCPHHEEGVLPEYAIRCTCRKPLPGLIWQARDRYQIDLSQSYMIGDKESDLAAARNAGCRGILVLTGYGRKEVHKITEKPYYIAKNLDDAARMITGR